MRQTDACLLCSSIVLLYLCTMKKTHIYTITSELGAKEAISSVTEELLDGLGIDYELHGSDFADYGSHALDVIHICTGGTEGMFLKLLPRLQAKSNKPFYLLTSGRHNSLAAAMEILSYLNQNNIKGEIIHGEESYISHRIKLLANVGEAREKLNSCRLGVIGTPSDWLISSGVDYDLIAQRLGIELVDIPMEELLNTITSTPMDFSSRPDDAFPMANRIYEALKNLLRAQQLQGFTMRCFDLLNTVRNTGCWAVAKLNSEGYVAGCEGDIPALLSMAIAHAAIGVSGFLANPATINPETGEVLVAHCTIPLNMVERYELDTHFESGIGIGIRGFMHEGPVTIFKVSGDLSRHYLAKGMLKMSLALPNLCRTQQLIQLNHHSDIDYFLNNPIGNHHIVLPGHQKSLLEELLKI